VRCGKWRSGAFNARPLRSLETGYLGFWAGGSPFLGERVK
jgi:hypothetical protein